MTHLDPPLQPSGVHARAFLGVHAGVVGGGGDTWAVVEKGRQGLGVLLREAVNDAYGIVKDRIVLNVHSCFVTFFFCSSTNQLLFFAFIQRVLTKSMQWRLILVI